MEHVAWIDDFLVFLAVAGLAVPLLHRFGVNQVLSFLVLGIAVGPYGFGRLSVDYPWLNYLTLDDRERVLPFAELGVMALLFLIGLELSWSRLAALKKVIASDKLTATAQVAPRYAQSISFKPAPIDGVSADTLAASLKSHGHRDARRLSSLDDLPAFVRAEAKPGDIVVCLGAGDITAYANALPAKLGAAAA